MPRIASFSNRSLSGIGIKLGLPPVSISSNLAVTEGSSITFSITTASIANGTTLYWYVINNTTTNSDFSAISGTMTVTNNSASFSVTTVSDSLLDSYSLFTVEVRNVLGQVLATSSSVSITHVPVNISFTRTIANPNPQDTPQNDRFGNSVAIVSNTLYAAAWGENFAGTTGPDDGKVYLYDITAGGTGSQLLQLDNRNESAGLRNDDRFGAILVADGDWLAITAPFEDVGGTNSGVIYIYNAAGTYIRTIQNPAYTSSLDAFGSTMDIADGVLFVGQPNHSTLNRAYIRSLSNAGAATVTITDPDNTRNYAFGYAVATGANKYAIGSPGHPLSTGNSGNSGAGRVYIANNTGGIETTINNPLAGTQLRFGAVLQADGGLLAVGSDSANNQNVYIYNITSGAIICTCTNPNLNTTNTTDSFGGVFALDATNGTIVISAIQEDTAIGADQGRVYVFNAYSGVYLGELVDPAPTTGGYFGSSVAHKGKLVAVGKPAATDGFGYPQAGRVDIFTLP